MSDRPRRKRKQNNNTVASNTHYVGYVEDEESVDAIMKKFEELDRIQREFQSMAVEPQSNNATTETSTSLVSDATSNQTSDQQTGTSMAKDGGDQQQGMTEEQLEEVFKRTSSFTVKSAMMDIVAAEDMDAMELWQVDFQDANTDVAFEEE
ncbi:hypothetical protein [Absidia glauca]|uniref:Uncharacterized protein n=1 Tax=Absidia glauca TaxID=4829 RepID=A0A163IT60_ABSGL|nr:hypothetical protein [Absidia glauca]